MGVLLAIISVVLAGISLTQSGQTLELDKWTALEEFRDQCKLKEATDYVRDICEKALQEDLPPPPQVEIPGTQLVSSSIQICTLLYFASQKLTSIERYFLVLHLLLLPPMAQLVPFLAFPYFPVVIRLFYHSVCVSLLE